MLVSGCGDDPVSSTPEGTPPGVGSIYRFTMPGNTAGSLDTLTISVTGAGGTMYGRTNVVSTASRISSDDSGGNPVFFIYESNGDLSIYIEGQRSTHSGVAYFESPTTWITYPFGSRKGETEVVKFDTTGVIDGKSVGFSVRHTVQYVGTEDLTLNGETLTAHKIVEKIRRTDTEASPARSYTAEYTNTYWYSPKIKFLPRMINRRTDDNGNVNESQLDLLDYTLK